jgi:pimeloyl-ACP methyl ester carboxylesterase
MPFFDDGSVRIHYEQTGTGFPLLIIPGGGLNSDLAFMRNGPFDPFATFGGEYRCIAADLRTAVGGGSSGPLDVERTWDAFADDQLGLLDHLGVREFAVMGFCIGGPMSWNLLKRAGDRIRAAVMVQPSGASAENRGLFVANNLQGWGPAFHARNPEVPMATIERFLARMYAEREDFVFTVSRDFVRGCRQPVLVLPDDIPAHPYTTAMESAMLAPSAQVSLFPWKRPPERIPLAIRHIGTFLRAHCPVR